MYRGGPTCKVCHKAIVEKEYWCCMACDGEYNLSYGFPRYTDADPATYICISCNFREEKEKPWLLRLRADSDRSHRPQHTLVLMTDPSTLTKEELPTTERFDRLERAIDGLRHQFAEHESVVSGRLQTLEELLERVLGCVGGSG